MSPSLLTLGKVGCTSTCVAMLSDYFGCYVSPDKAIDCNIKYTNQGLILWQNISYPCFKFEKRLYGFQENEIDAALKDPRKAVILEVANGSHWVVAVRKVPFTHLYWIVDPWDGKQKLSSAYKNITGCAIFVGNSSVVPPYSF